MAYKKEQIKDQMIRTAARLWGVPDNEVETNFDPLILLMMEACAAELEKIGYDISTSHSRLLERLAGLVIPESVLGPQPASCVMQAQPSETQAHITPLNGFYTSQAVKLQGGMVNTDLHFSPIGDFTLHRATLGHVYAGSKLFKIGEGGSKTLLHAADIKGGSNEIWLAINIDSNLQTLEGLHLFFDLRSHSEAT